MHAGDKLILLHRVSRGIITCGWGIGSLLAPIFLFWPVLFGATTQASRQTPGFSGVPYPEGTPLGAPSDPFRLDVGASTWQFEPWANLVAFSFRRFEIPWWNPYEGAGKPFVANMQSAVFDPLLLPVHLFPSQGMWDVCIIGAYVLGSGCMYKLLTVIGIVRPGAFLGALIFSGSGYFALYNNNSFSRGFIFLPMIALALELLVKKWSGRRVAFLSLALIGNVVIGMPEITMFVIVASGIYGALMLASVRDQRVTRRVLGATLVAGSLAILAVSPVLYLFLQFEGRAFSTHKAGDLVGLWADPFDWLTYWVTPFINGPPKAPLVAPGGVRNWVGAAAITLTVLAPLGGLRQFWKLRGAAFFCVTAIVVWKCYGIVGFEFFGRLPGLDRLNSPAFFLPAAAFGIAGMAAIGFHVVYIRRLPMWKVYCVAVFLCLTALWVARVHNSELQLADDSARRALAGSVAVMLVLISFVFYSSRARWKRQRIGLLMLVVASLEIVLLFPNSQFQARSSPYAERPLSQFLYSEISKSNDGAAVGRISGLNAKLFPDSQVAFRIPGVFTLDALYLERYWVFIQTFVNSTVFDRYVGGPYATSSSEDILTGNPFVDLLGVEYVATDFSNTGAGTLATFGDFRRVAEFPADDYSPSATAIWRNEDVAPRAFLVGETIPAMSIVDAERLMQKVRSSLIPRSGMPGASAVAVVEAVNGRDYEAWKASCDVSQSSTAVKIAEYGLNSVVIDVHAPCAATLVLTDSYDPGWIATINGQPTPVLPADVAFRSVAVPEGQSRVVFRYEPLRGSPLPYLSGFALIIIMVLVFVGRSFGPRRTA
jgi:hypothetical protein